MFLPSKTIQAQTPTRAQLEQSVQAQGVDPAELERRLIAKGYNINSMSEQELIELRPIVEAEIAAMKSEKEAASNPIAEEKTEEVVASPPPKAPSTESTVNASLKVETPNSSVFGYELFEPYKRGSQPSRAIKDDYILGPGDEMILTILGVSQAEVLFKIDDRGYINPERVPKIYLKGLTLAQARKKLIRVARDFYTFRDDEFVLQVSSSRTVQIEVVGEVPTPGRYVFKATETLLDVLARAGGIKGSGTLRAIQLIRDGKTNSIDLYAYFIDPNNINQLYLQDGDVLFIPLQGPLVEINGAVKRQRTFEFLPDEDARYVMDELAAWDMRARKDLVQVERFTPEGLQAYEYDFTTDIPYKFKDGDLVTVLSYDSDQNNTVRVTGAVQAPGIFAIQDYKTFKDLIPVVIPDSRTRLDVAYVTRILPDGREVLFEVDPEAQLNGEAEPFVFEGNETVQFLKKAAYVDETRISVQGMVREPGDFSLDSNVTVSALIDLSRGFRDEALQEKVFVFRKTRNGETRTIAIDEANYGTAYLQDLDRLFVAQVEGVSKAAYISISGEVNESQLVPYDAGFTLIDLVAVASGTTLYADLDQIWVYRVTWDPEQKILGEVNEMQLSLEANAEFTFEPFDVVVVRRKPGLELQRIVQLDGEFTYPGTYAVAKGEKLSSVIERAGGITDEAQGMSAFMYRENEPPMALNIDKILKGSYSDISLQSGDRIVVPSLNEQVTIRLSNTLAGDNRNQLKLNSDVLISAPYVEGKSAKWYVKNFSGGIGEKGSKRHLLVQHSNQLVEGTSGFLFFKNYPEVYPSSSIVVGRRPEKPKKEKPEGETFDINKFSATFLTSTTAILTILILINQLQ